MTFVRRGSGLPGYEGLTTFAGDIHNHCGISYGHGSIDDAYRNARLQLDFASVTGHAAWHDMPDEPAHVAEYHRRGFARLREHWGEVQDFTEEVNNPHSFVSFLSFEWHSLAYGDHCVYYDTGRGPLDPSNANDLPSLRRALRDVRLRGADAMVLPHHIGYRSGRRGVNWDAYTEEFSPVVELVSMHGSGEHHDSPRPYLHTMGPRDIGSTATTGLARGGRFGFIGSTDHHSAHPGSYGHGLAMVWAEDLTRESIWQAIRQRRTYAATGGRIMLATSINGAPMGSTVVANGERRILVDVRGGNALDRVEIIRNGEVIARNELATAAARDADFSGIVSVAMGWGEVGIPVDWDVELELRGGRIDAVEPRLHGYDTLADQAGETDKYSFSAWEQRDERTIRLRTRTRGNPTVSTDATQRLAVHVSADRNAELVATVNGREFTATITDMLDGPHVHYLGGFLSGAFAFEKAVQNTDASLQWEISDKGGRTSEDWYYVRVSQVDDQHAWSSPIWVSDASA